MKNKTQSRIFKLTTLQVACLLLASMHTGVHAQSSLVISDDFRKSTSSQQWNVFDGACLTAGSMDQAAATTATKIPKCVGNSYYNGITLNGGQTGSLPDAAGQGALRFTNNTNGERGAIISNFTFPSNSGVAVTFNTVTYGGNGADGMTFFMADGAIAPNIGATGGSLGYSCSNTNSPYNGMTGAYIGLGMDEYGNFLNKGDNTSTGPSFQPGRIGLRGAGNINGPWLKANYSAYYPSTLTGSNLDAAVQQTCQTGTVWDYSNGASNKKDKKIAIPNYNAIPNGSTNLPVSTPLYSVVGTRPAANPVTYQLKITNGGLLSLKYSYNGGAYQAVLTNQSITASNGPLPANLRFGFTGATGGLNNIHEISCFRAEPATDSNSSAGVTGQKSGEIKQGTQVLSSFYKPSNSTGTVLARNVVVDTNGVPSASSTVNWDAGCTLTGGACATTGASPSGQAATSRTILTWNDATNAGVPFEFANLSAGEKAALTAGDSTANTPDRLNFLRGDRTKEVQNGGIYRQRDSVLADIVNSSAQPIGGPVFGFQDIWVDRTNGAASLPENTTTAGKYTAFANANAARQNVAYVGANDGMLHGFRMGSLDSTGALVNNATTPNDGKEVLAYMPGVIANAIHNNTTAGLDFSNVQYGHAFDVDATPDYGDVFYGNAWHTWLVGGLGAGGQAIYALDITNPSNFSEANAATLVKGEWTPTSLNVAGACANVATNCGNYMGNTFGTPQVRRFHNGKWGFIFGNGYGSTNGKAGIYIVTIDSTTAATTVYFLNTNVGGANGIAFPSAFDADGDHITDYVYGGDLKGNLWRFDLTSSDPANWKVSTYGNGTTPTPLFTTPSGVPITTAPTTPIVLEAGNISRAIISVGTGQLTPQTLSTPNTYSTGQQYMYGIWDWDMTAWNTLTNGRKLVSAVGPISITASKLQSQTITGPITDPSGGSTTLFTATANPVCWASLAACTGTLAKYGWVTPLPGTNEQIIDSPKLDSGLITFNTITPANNSPLTCTASDNTGTTYSVSPTTGGAIPPLGGADPKSFYANNAGVLLPINGQAVIGVSTAATGSPSFVTVRGKRYVVTQDASGNISFTAVTPPNGGVGKRISWQQIR
jgi:type IV pilus assembly protein PilY1